MTTLTLKSVPQTTAKTVVVDVPEFGEGVTINVLPMTVATNNALMQLTKRIGLDGDGKQAFLDNGRDQASTIAAMHSVDDDGKLTFGKTLTEAINRVESLPIIYRPAIIRISMTATTNGRGEAGIATVDDAEKN